MNTFCLQCTGHDAKEVRQCEDKTCPFFLYRKADLPYQQEFRRKKLEK